MTRLAGVPVGAKQVERLCRRIGAERVAERDAQVVAYQALPLMKKCAAPAGVPPPEVAVVMGDGGRLQILDRAAAANAPAADPPAADPPAADPPAADPPHAAADGTIAAEVWDEEKVRKGHWREDKVALLLTMHSDVSVTDPCPNIPSSFLDVARMGQLVRELSRHIKEAAAAGDGADGVTAPADPNVADTYAYQPPAVVQRQVLASRRTWPSFAPIVAQAAWALGFQEATRKAFVGDGSANHWRLQRRFFASFVPILDFIHALSYVYAAALAGQSQAAGWACYRQWIAWVWQGQVEQVIVALAARQAELGLPQAEEAESSPRQIVARTLTYLGNQQGKMHYDEYRRQGLPITSSLMESVVKQVNQRVKGTEKFWSEEGAEALLQLRADHLSDGQPLDEFWQRRQAAAEGQRGHRRAA